MELPGALPLDTYFLIWEGDGSCNYPPPLHVFPRGPLNGPLDLTLKFVSIVGPVKLTNKVELFKAFIQQIMKMVSVSSFNVLLACIGLHDSK